MDIDQSIADLEPLPSVAERLKGLNPSKELLEFYRKKCADFDAEHAMLVDKLNRYRKVYKDKRKVEFELTQREKEVTELQKALSDTQVYLFQERDHVLRLYAENDRLKIQELEDRKKIQKLLAMTAPLEHETTYFPPADTRFVEPHPNVKKIAERVDKARRKQASSDNGQSEPADQGQDEDNLLDESDRVQSLLLTIDALKAQLEDQVRLSTEQTNALLEDRKIREQETAIVQQRQQERIEELTSKVHKLQELLHDSTRDFLDLKFEQRKALQTSEEEKERLIQRISELQEDIDSYQNEAMEALRARTNAAMKKKKTLVVVKISRPRLEFVRACFDTAKASCCGQTLRRMMSETTVPSQTPEYLSRRASAATTTESGEADEHEYHDMGTSAYRPGGRSGGLHASQFSSSDWANEDQRQRGRKNMPFAMHKLEMQESMTEAYREQCIKLEEEISRLKEERDAAHQFQSTKYDKLTKRIKMWQTRYEALERRRKLEIEGYQTDIRNLRAQLRQLEAQTFKLAMAS